MSARELRSLRGSQISPPKLVPGARKRLQSNADEAIPKRSKTTNNDEDIEGEPAEQQPVKKAAKKGEDKKGKKTRFVAYPYTSDLWSLTGSQQFRRMTAAQRAAKDNIEDAKGPVSLTL
jgi:hypothetical protein